MEGFLFQASIYLAAAVIAVPIASRLGLGSVLGYLAAGILIGPAFGLVGSETKDLQHFAEFGVVMMLFLIGLELEPRALWNMRHRLLGLGGMQVVLSAAALMGIAMAYDQPMGVAIAIGLTLSLSSTAIVLQTLSEKGLMQTAGGRSVFSVLLTQDIAVIPILAFLPLLVAQLPAQMRPDGSISVNPEDAAHGAEAASGHGPAAAGHGAETAQAAISLVQGLPGWAITLVTLGAIAGIIITGVFFTRPVFRFIHAAKLREMYTALALLIVVGISFLMMLVGLSPALGAFLAGVVLASSEFRHELETDLEPFKGLLLGLFFITVGAGVNFGVLAESWDIVLLLALAVIIGKRGRHIEPPDALSYVAGYSCLNEGSLRDWSGRGTQNCPAKNFYHSGSFGPWLVTAEEVPDPARLNITTRLSGEVRQNGGTDLMIFDIPYVISHISKFTWLEAGDVIATGTNHRGLSAFQNADKVELEVQGLGVLHFSVQDDLKRTWSRDTRLEHAEKGLDGPATPQLTGKYAPS